MDDEKAKILRRKQRFSAENQQKPQHGLVSKGETSLKTEKTARDFFMEIKSEFVSFYEGNVRLNDEELNALVGKRPISNKDRSGKIKPDIIMNLRKLREALISSKNSEFASEVFLFSVRVGILLNNYQTFLPSLAYLWNDSGLSKYLNSNEQWEVVYLQMIYQTISKHDFNDSLRRFQTVESVFDSEKVKNLWMLIDCLTTRNYTVLHRIIQKETSVYILCLLEHLIDEKLAEEISVQLEKSYLRLPETSLQSLTGLNLLQLKHCRAQWTYENQTIMIRNRKK